MRIYFITEWAIGMLHNNNIYNNPPPSSLNEIDMMDTAFDDISEDDVLQAGIYDDDLASFHCHENNDDERDIGSHLRRSGENAASSAFSNTHGGGEGGGEGGGAGNFYCNNMGNDMIGNMLLVPLKPLEPESTSQRVAQRSEKHRQLVEIHDADLPPFAGGDIGRRVDGWDVLGDDNYEEEILSNCDANDVANACSAPTEFFDLLEFNNFNTEDDGNHDPAAYPDMHDIQKVLTSSISDGGTNSGVGKNNVDNRHFIRRNTHDGSMNLFDSMNFFDCNANNSKCPVDLQQYGEKKIVRTQRRKTLDDVLCDPTEFDANHNSEMPPVQNQEYAKRRKSDPISLTCWGDDGREDLSSSTRWDLGAQPDYTNYPSQRSEVQQGNRLHSRQTSIEGSRNLFDSNANRTRSAIGLDQHGRKNGGRAQRRRNTNDDVLFDPTKQLLMMLDANPNAGMPPVQSQQASVARRKSDPISFSSLDDVGREMPSSDELSSQLDHMNSILQQTQSSNSGMIPAAFLAASREAVESISRLKELFFGTGLAGQLSQMTQQQNQMQMQQGQQQMQGLSYGLGQQAQGNSFRQFSIDRQESSQVAATGQNQPVPKPSKKISKKGSANKKTPLNSALNLIDGEIPLPSKPDPELLSLDPTDAMSKLMASMERTNNTQKQLQDWDSSRGLPKSHSQTMVNSSRSRKQLLDGVVLKVRHEIVAGKLQFL